MLYKLNTQNNSIEPMPFYDFAALSMKEKDLENLMAERLGELYVEDGQLMPIFQERSWQEEPDLCALDRDGNLVIFELKRGKVPGDTTIQVMRYTQTWGQKTYYELQQCFQTYSRSIWNLNDAHKEAFGLDKALDASQFNQKQRMVLVGSYSDTELISAVDYWKSQGVKIDFIPYRIYKMDNELYFEFFSKPYDVHLNPRDIKGILFDTNATYDKDAIWDMLNHSKVSAYGSVASAVYSFKKGDFVFYYHKGYGVVAAGEIISGVTENPADKQEDDEFYCKVRLLIPKVVDPNNLKYIPYAELCELLNKKFYLARTTKVPYLSKDECEQVLACLRQKYNE